MKTIDTMAKTKTKITDNEWLDLSWKYFQLHAQQRTQYFNYFVVFSTILSSGLIATFQNNFQLPYLGIGIGLIQMFLSYIFWKIDDRNKFLTKHSENIIKEIETDYKESENKTYKLFTNEEIETEKQKRLDKHSIFLCRQFSHGKSYRVIFIVFFIIGLIGVIISSNSYLVKSKNKNELQRIDSLLIYENVKYKTMGSMLKNQDSIIRLSKYKKYQHIQK